MPQSLVVEHFKSHPVPAALQTRSPGQELAIPLWQFPLPSQTPGVRVLPLQESQVVPAKALTQAPLESQSAMPHTVAPAVQAELQQLPFPSRPQICESHWSLDVQGEPA